MDFREYGRGWRKSDDVATAHWRHQSFTWVHTTLAADRSTTHYPLLQTYIHTYPPHQLPLVLPRRLWVVAVGVSIDLVGSCSISIECIVCTEVCITYATNDSFSANCFHATSGSDSIAIPIRIDLKLGYRCKYLATLLIGAC